MSSYDSDDIVRECISCRRCYPSNTPLCPDCRLELHNLETVPFTINYRYQLTRLLSHGGTGHTFLALDDSHQQVVIRIIRASALAAPRALDRFRREANQACHFHHANVASIIDCGMLADASGYLVSEYIEGPTLREVLQQRGKLEVREAVRILIDLCDALDAVHRAGLLHRDLKPESIILRYLPDLPDPTISLVGFSFTRIAFGPLYRPGATARLQGQGFLPLSPNYLSPEQFRGEESDARSDIYSVGVIGYEMLAGHPPFSAERTESLLLRHLTEKPAPLHSTNPAVATSLESEIMRALEKDPYSRHQRAIELKRELVNAGHVF
jgi:serine/threonine protein kinase